MADIHIHPANTADINILEVITKMEAILEVVRKGEIACFSFVGFDDHGFSAVMHVNSLRDVFGLLGLIRMQASSLEHATANDYNNGVDRK